MATVNSLVRVENFLKSNSLMFFTRKSLVRELGVNYYSINKILDYLLDHDLIVLSDDVIKRYGWK